MGEILPSFLPEFVGVLLFAFLEKDGGLRPLLCGSIWRRCAARLISDYTRDAAHKYFTTTYPNFMQCAVGLQDGATRCAQLLNMLYDLPTEEQDPDDPVTFHQHRHQGCFSGNVPLMGRHADGISRTSNMHPVRVRDCMFMCG